jgi:hypothetical protein
VLKPHQVADFVRQRVPQVGGLALAAVRRGLVSVVEVVVDGVELNVGIDDAVVGGGIGGL